MKVIAIVVILGIICSPALAINIADFRATDWRSTPLPEIKTKLPTIVVPTPTPTPTSPPTLTRDVWLWVNSTPTRAMVYIDGHFRGLTPITIEDISVGTHQLRLSRLGYEDYSTEIVIPELSCPLNHPLKWCAIKRISIDVTLKKVESTQNPSSKLFPAPPATEPPVPEPPAPKPPAPAWSEEEYREAMDRFYEYMKNIGIRRA